MVYKSENYKPNKRGQKILERARFHIREVPYSVTLRWLFYALLQDGFYEDKDGYQSFKELLSNARHNYYDIWRPDTLVDDMRAAIIKTGEGETAADWVKKISGGVFGCELDHFYRQNYYVEIWFEAGAMIRQFMYYTSGITLRPFRGQPSIPYKYEMAKYLMRAAEQYGKEIIILYFGDYDNAGFEIQTIAEEHVRDWCSVDFELIRCGLNAGDGQRLGIPEKPNKPGQYQWEALGDPQAKELITSSVNRYVDANIVREVKAEGIKPGEYLNDFLEGFEEYYEMRLRID